MNKRIKKKQIKALKTYKRITANRARTFVKYANKFGYEIDFDWSQKRLTIIPYTIYTLKYVCPSEYSEIYSCCENEEISVASITKPLRSRCRYVVLCDDFQGMGDTFAVIDIRRNIIYEIALWGGETTELMNIWKSPVCRGRTLGAWRKYQVCCDELNEFDIDESSHESLHNSLCHIIDTAREKLKITEIRYIVTEPDLKTIVKEYRCIISEEGQ